MSNKVRLTRNQLKSIIREQVRSLLHEQQPSTNRDIRNQIEGFDESTFGTSVRLLIDEYGGEVVTDEHKVEAIKQWLGEHGLPNTPFHPDVMGYTVDVHHAFAFIGGEWNSNTKLSDFHSVWGIYAKNPNDGTYVVNITDAKMTGVRDRQPHPEDAGVEMR